MVMKDHSLIDEPIFGEVLQERPTFLYVSFEIFAWASGEEGFEFDGTSSHAARASYLN